MEIPLDSAKIAYQMSVIGIAAVVLIITGAVYWPVLHANFVWFDFTDFVDMPWLRQGDLWKHYIFKNFNGWSFYFRPLVVGLYTLEVRAFGSVPGPMHAVSLGLHLFNALLVGLLAQCLRTLDPKLALKDGRWTISIAMLLYGLHPVLIEAVVWVNCQFELVVTLFTLLGLLINLCIRRRMLRALLVGCSFFLAASAKETAAVFPLLLVSFDWLVLARQSPDRNPPKFIDLLKRNWVTFAACLLAGVAYLLFRHWALGNLIGSHASSSSSLLSQAQQVSFRYMQYWKLLVWPTSGQGPIHPYDQAQFDAVSWAGAANFSMAVVIAITGFYSAIRRSSAIGHMIVVATISLLPVLGIVRIEFDPSLYHERYALTALAMMCPLLAVVDVPNVFRTKLLNVTAAVLLCLWLVIGVVGIRAITPLWSDNVRLWEWASRSYPSSSYATDLLLSAYVNAGEISKARAIGDRLLAEKTQCINCLLNESSAAISSGDIDTATRALDLLQTVPALATDKSSFESYLSTRGNISLIKNRLTEAERLLRAASNLDPLDAKTKYNLAITLGLLGNAEEARSIGQKALVLLPATGREKRRQTLEEVITKGQSLLPTKINDDHGKPSR
jgi:hypothetical protein